LALTYDGTKVILFLYYPNAGQQCDMNSVAPLQGTFAGYKPNTSASLLVGVGRNLFPSVPDTPGSRLYAFHGKIQEVALYNQALTINAALCAHEQAGGSF
jgi:hypothetical protein